MVKCPACGEEAELLDESEKVDQTGERHPEWEAVCRNDDCRAGVLLKSPGVSGEPDTFA